LSPDPGRSGRSFVPPRWVYRTIWTLHRAGYAISGGRLGLRSGAADRLGTLRLRTTGRKSGAERSTMLFYLPAGSGFAVVASNAGANYAPAWWLNLQALPEGVVGVPGRSLPVTAREAAGEEREGLWRQFVQRLADYQRYAETAEREIPIVILEPTEEGADA
jgi:deazaflavin-dependent oxidoreductase (nitroreductase family)